MRRWRDGVSPASVTAQSENQTERLLVLDATRGAAVMGILLINIVSFAMPEAAYVNPTVWGWDTPFDRIAWVVNQLLFEGRMRGLFALLFGASALLVMDRAAAAGERPVAVHFRRMTVLALIGAAHLVFVWDGDILLHYALLGLVIWVARDWSVRALVRAAAIALALHVVAWGGSMGGALLAEVMAARPGADPKLVAEVAQLRAQFPGGSDAGLAAEFARMLGNYAGIVSHRAQELRTLPFWFLQMLGGETLCYMLLGMALFRSGFFTGGWSGAQLRRLLVIGYATGLPALAALTWWAFAWNFDPILLLGSFLAWSVPFRVPVALAHLALAVLLLRRFAGSAAAARLAAVGRMALSNYLATSIVMTTLFYGYGFGLFGAIGRAPLNLIVVAMWAAMVLWSRPWLARYRFGPVEWLWRSLARWRVQPLRGAAR